MQSFWTVFDSFESVTLSSNGHTNVQIIITIFQETSIFFILTRFLRISDSKEVIFVDEPIS